MKLGKMKPKQELRPQRDQLVRIMKESGIRYSETGSWLTIAKTMDYRINIGNTEIVRRIDIFGFNPPKNVPGFRLMDHAYVKIMGQFVLDEPIHYILELFRAVALGMQKLRPQSHHWTRQSAPTIELNHDIINILKRIYEAEMSHVRKKRTEDIYKPVIIPYPAREYLINDDEMVFRGSDFSDELTPVDLPVLPFDDGVETIIMDTVIDRNNPPTVKGRK